MPSYSMEDMNLSGLNTLFSPVVKGIKCIINGCMTFIGWWFGLFIGIVSVFETKLGNGWITMMDKLDRRRIIMDREDDNKPYLERYYLFLRDRGERIPFNIFIHKFLRSDPDDFHNHPWGYFTLILKGGYYEHIYINVAKTRTKRFWRGPGFYRVYDAEHTHRIELAEGVGPCWTLFIPFMKKRKWGFWRHTIDDLEETIEWIENEQYFLDKAEERERRINRKKNK